MSKLGKKPILIPKDAKVKLESGKLIMSGPKGSRELNLNDKIIVDSKNHEKLSPKEIIAFSSQIGASKIAL